MRKIGEVALIAALLSACGVCGQELTIPSVGQPTPFYNAAGKKVVIEATATPTDLTADETILLTLRITGLINAAEVQRPKLAEIEALDKDFQIDDETADVAEPPGTRVFQYRLKPRGVKVKAIPEIVFPFYDPSIPQPADRPGLPFRKARSNAIPLTIRKTPPPPSPIVPLDVPAFAESLTPERTHLPSWLIWIGIAFPPLACLAWMIAWRVMNPKGARLARRRRARAARHALKTLHSLVWHHAADPRSIVDCMAVYWAHRYELPGVFRTPPELAANMRKAGTDETAIAECTQFLRDADAARFAPNPSTSVDALIADAERLVRESGGVA